MQDYHIVFLCAVLIIIATGMNTYRIFNVENKLEKQLKKALEGQENREFSEDSDNE